MRVTIDLDPVSTVALRRLANHLGQDVETFAARLVDDALTLSGMIEPEHELDDDTETRGSA